MGLTQKDLAARAKVSIGALQRLEAGVMPSRRSDTWPKFEAVFGWPPGFIEDFVTNKVTGPGDSDERFVRVRGATEDFVHDLVLHVTMSVAPDTPIGRIVELEAQGRRLASQHGLPVAGDTPETETSSK
jgi:hypothetical protein